MYFEVDENPNCPNSVSMRFKEVGPVKRVKQLRVSDRKSEGELCWVTGWSDDSNQPLCPAYAQPVEESGQGLAYLIYGGNWGLRLKPVDLNEDWDLSSPNQWGEAFLLIASPRSIVYAEETENR
ncbi:MAG TPA: hypothetical protein VLY20_04295 [Nitrospiria bacterium]|nr:hypothetical protein [Nitrospiria bacterium]HUK55858.1 hypothetical protein [Nitrospiria bacterium]